MFSSGMHRNGGQRRPCRMRGTCQNFAAKASAVAVRVLGFASAVASVCACEGGRAHCSHAVLVAQPRRSRGSIEQEEAQEDATSHAQIITSSLERRQATMRQACTCAGGLPAQSALEAGPSGRPAACPSWRYKPSPAAWQRYGSGSSRRAACRAVLQPHTQAGPTQHAQALALGPFDAVTSERGFLPSPDPLRR